MHPSARIAAAIEVLDDLETRRRPAADALKDWGLAHRFAGSKDRAGIASLVFDVLRRRASARWLMKSETPRAEMIGALALARDCRSRKSKHISAASAMRRPRSTQAN